jgi:CubicO group peptidase (beta-lactamase class C family)
MASSPPRIAAMTCLALSLAATAAVRSGSCAPAPPAYLLGPTPDTAATVVEAASDHAVRLNRLLSGFETLGFSGAIVVEEGGRVVLRKGYGLADRPRALVETLVATGNHNLALKLTYWLGH